MRKYGRTGGTWVAGDCEQQLDDERPMDAVDDYEAEIDAALNGPTVCEGYDCRSPREGPFVIDLSDDDYPTLFCWRCFAEERLRIDPDEIGRVGV